MYATVKELLKLVRICESYRQIKNGLVFLTYSVYSTVKIKETEALRR